jgi:hypothetical protein
VKDMVGPVNEAIAVSEIKEDSNIVAEGHQDNQYTNFSGAAEDIVVTTTDAAMGVVDGIIAIPTDVVDSARKAITPTSYINKDYFLTILGVGFGAGLVNAGAAYILGLVPSGIQVVSSFATIIVGSTAMYLGMSASSDFYKYALITSGAGLAYQGFRGIVDSLTKRSETVTKRSPSGSGHVSAGQSNYQVDTSPFTIDPEMTRKDVTLAAEVASGPSAEGNFGEGDVLPVNYGQGGVTAVEHDQSFAQATGSLQRRGSDAKNAFVESVMPKTTSYQPQAYYAEDTPTMIQKNAHYTAETKAGIQNVFNSYQAPTTTARRGGNSVPRRMTKNANGTTISNEMKGAIGMGSVIGQ